MSSSRLIQLSKFLKVPITYFYEDYKDFEDIEKNNLENNNDDLNYSFLTKTFSSLSKTQKEKILQVLRNTSSLDKTGT